MTDRPPPVLPADGPVAAAMLAAAAPSERLSLLVTTAAGLADAEVARWRAAVGPNEPAPPARRRPLRTFLANFTHTLALLLWFAAGLAFAGGITALGGAIIAVVLVNGVFAWLQERRAEQVLASLMRRVAVQATVRRAGASMRLPAADLVPGDVIVLRAGDIAPADVVLLAADGLTVDLSLLTGESLPVERVAAPHPSDAGRALTDLTAIVPAGAAIVSGGGEAAVFATGPASTLGSIAHLVAGVQRGQSALERQVAELSRVTAVVAVLAGAITLTLAAFTRGTTFREALTFGTGVIVALVPEGLLPTLSVSLAIGARRMAARGAAVRRLAAVEVIGAATVICTDKTGTLTQNQFTVLGVVGPDGDAQPTTALLQVAALCNDATPHAGDYTGDPLDVALARWARDAGHDAAAARAAWTRLDARPFDARRRVMAVTCLIDGQPTALLKGAPEAVLAATGADVLPPVIAAALDAATRRGERVLLLARGPAGAPPTIAGLVRFSDPPRPGVDAAIAACRRAGIRVVMLTGDHPATARALAATIGLNGDLPVVEGRAVDTLPDGALSDMLRGNAIFARVDPAQKLRLVQLCRRLGEIVVVTGDGINDAPALRAADVGVAMGQRGTEVAKQAADIVLADDNFATIVAAIEEGRSIKANIRRFISYVFTSNVAELAPFLLYIFFPVPLALAVIQALAVDLGTDLLPALALGVEPPSAATLARAPAPPREPLLTRRLGLETFLFFGLIEAALGLVGFFAYHLALGWRPFASFAPYADRLPEATALTFLGIVAGQLGCLVSRRDGRLHQRLAWRANGWLRWGVLTELALALALVYLPGLNDLFQFAPVAPAWLLIVPLGAALFIALDTARRVLTDKPPVRS